MSATRAAAQQLTTATQAQDTEALEFHQAGRRAETAVAAAAMPGITQSFTASPPTSRRSDKE